MAEDFAGAKPKVPREINSCIATAKSHGDIQKPTKHKPQSARCGQNTAPCKKLGPVGSKNADGIPKKEPNQNKSGQPAKSNSLASQDFELDAYTNKHVEEEEAVNCKHGEETFSVRLTPGAHLKSASTDQNGFTLEDGVEAAPDKVEEAKAVNDLSGSSSVAIVTVDSDSELLSSGSVSSDLRPTTEAAANQEEDNWSCDCNSQKCNCGGDWSFKVPRVLDNLDENIESSGCKTKAQPCVGSVVGPTVGHGVRSSVGQVVGPTVGHGVGSSVGPVVGQCVGAQKGKPQKKIRKNRKLSKERAGLLDSALTSSDDEFEFVFDDRYGEIVCRRKSAPKKEKCSSDPYLSALLSQTSESHNTDPDTSRPILRADRADRADPNPLGSLKHALPYLPESLRTRLAARQADHISSDHAGDTVDNTTVDRQTLTTPAERMDANTERSCINTNPTPEYVGSSCNTSKTTSGGTDRSSNKVSRDIATSSNKASRDIDRRSNKASRDSDRSSNKASRDIDRSSNKASKDIDRSSNKATPRNIDTSSKDVNSRIPDSCSITTNYDQDRQFVSCEGVIDSTSNGKHPVTCDKDKQCNKNENVQDMVMANSHSTSRGVSDDTIGDTAEADKDCSIPRVPNVRQGQTATRWIDDDILSFEDSLEDPFRVKNEGRDLAMKATGRDLDMCSGLVDLIQDIDAPLVDSLDSDDNDIRSQLASLSADRSTRKSCLSNCRAPAENARGNKNFNDSYNITKRSYVLNNDGFDDRETRSTLSNYSVDENSDTYTVVDKHLTDCNRNCSCRDAGGSPIPRYTGNGGLCTLQAQYPHDGAALQLGAAGAISDEISEVVSEVGLLGAVRDFASKVHDLCSSIRDLPTAQSPRSASDDALLWQSGSGSASEAGGDSCVEADDEFECDCDMCARLPQTDLDPDLDLGASGEAGRLERLEEMRYGAETELPSPDSILRLTAEMDVDLGLGDVTEPASLLLDTSLQQIVLIESVIQQMLSLQPDLLSSMAPPAAPESVIDLLPTVALTPQSSEQHPTCPICLSPCEVGEEMTRLPCQHLFHPVCIRAWLTKSGTCPVCRQSVVG